MEPKTSDKDLNKFLGKVDEINAIMHGLNSGDMNEQAQAMSNADKVLERINKHSKTRDHTGENRTVINQAVFNDTKKEPATSQNGNAQTDQDAFMSAMERDAEERYQRRLVSKKKATDIKDRGNVKFRDGDYNGAIELYTEALAEFKDMTALWTNRAQAYNKTEEYDKALHDCDWALRVFENCAKAYVQQGKAHLGLKHYDEAIASYKQVEVIEPNKKKVVQGYIDEVELCRKSHTQESEASELFTQGDTQAKTVVELLHKINNEKQLALYYSGGLRTLCQIIKGVNEQTLYRIHGGLQLSQTHSVLSNCFKKEMSSLDSSEVDMISCLLRTHEIAVANNGENCRQLLEVSGFSSQLSHYLSSVTCKDIQLFTLSLLHVISEIPVGRSTICEQFDCCRLLSSLLHIMTSDCSLSIKAVGLLNNVVLDEKFRNKLQNQVLDLLPSLEKIMLSADDATVLPCCISTIMNLCGNQYIRKTLQKQKKVWQLCCTVLDKSQHNKQSDVLHSILGLLMNLSFNSSEQLAQFGSQLCESCCRTVTDPHTMEETQYRAWNVISHVLPVCDAAIRTVLEKNLIKHLVDNLKGSHDVLKVSVKCLTACAQNDDVAKQQIYEHKGISALLPLLNHTDETIVGNAALCLSSCVSIPGVVQDLCDTDVLKTLLAKARDCQNQSAQQNCAILIGKLTQADESHRERLRELDGYGILHSVIQSVK